MKRHKNAGFDMRITVYHSVKIIVAAVVIALLAKVTLVDTLAMNGSQMTPSIIEGDRIIIFKFPYSTLFYHFFPPAIDLPVAFKNHTGVNILRVAAVSSDTLRIDSGKVFTSRSVKKISTFSDSGEVIPAEYAPRDFMETYRLPGKNSILPLTKLSLRDFFFAVAMIRQENSNDSVFVKPYLLLDDSICQNAVVTDFMFFNGSIDSVPDSLRYNWFFWNRLEEYFYQKYSDQKVTLYFSLLLRGTALDEYTLRHDFYFLLADNRTTGLDSRYFGPVSRSAVFGRPLIVLWSHGNDDSDKPHFRFNRMGRMIQ